MKKYSEKKWTEFFAFLDNLRESGATNMYAAAPYVMTAFSVDRNTAVNITSVWTKTFDREKAPAVRATEYLATILP